MRSVKMAKSSNSGPFNSDNVAVFLSELLGTALLVFLGCSSCIFWNESGPSELQVVLSFGFAVLICVQIFGCVSGAHINPAVTVAAVIYKLISVQVKWHDCFLFVWSLVTVLKFNLFRKHLHMWWHNA